MFNTNIMKTNLLLILIFSIMLIGCSEEKMEPMGSNTTPPGQVTNVSIESQPGQVKLTYTLPKDQDLLYVKAVYLLNSGVEREIKSSYYTNSMILDGFGDTFEHDVKIYSVNRNETESEPLNVKVKPLENPIWEVFRSLEVKADFSGVKIQAENPSKHSIAVEVMIKDSLGTWQKSKGIETKSAKIEQTNRGLDTIEYEFRVTVRDRFLNYTDTITKKITPFYEAQADRTLFREMKLPGDAQQQHTGWLDMNRIWDGNKDWQAFERFMTVTYDLNPQTITFDMGQSIKLNRMTSWNWANGQLFYYQGMMRMFEIWGSNNPAADGSWDSWTLLGEFENIKPSGLPYGQQTTEDFEAGKQGFDFYFDDAPKIRYLRVKCIRNWEGTTWMEIKELEFFGDPR